MATKETWCEPVFKNGYWQVDVITEYIPGWFARLIGRKAYSYTTTFTNISDDEFRTPWYSDWKIQPSGNAAVESGNIFDDTHFRLSDWVERHQSRLTLERLQEEEFQKGPHG